MSKKLLLVMNPVSGKKKANKYLADILSLFSENDYECTVCVTTKRKRANSLVEKFGKGKDLIVCIGGDGTFNETVSGMRNARINSPLGYIPSGSTNDFASSLNLSSTPLQACRDILNGKTISIDIGLFCGRLFTYVASFGTFTKTSYATPSDLKNALGHLAYILEGVKEIGDIRPEKLVIEHDGITTEGNYVFGAVCNTRRVGGGVLRFSDDVVDMCDGLFEVVLIKMPTNPADMIQLLMDLQSANPDGAMFDFFRSSDIKIKTSESMNWTLDGEFEKGKEFIEIKVIKNAISMIVPDNNRK